MNKKSFALLLASCLTAAIFFTQKSPEPKVNFYDRTFLRNALAAEKALKARGFFEIDLITQDGVKINNIMLDNSAQHKIQATIISLPGFMPGNKEGMATLYHMLQDQPYNFIFIDSRGHGKSEGKLLTYKNIKHYGQSEYLDMIAVIQFIASYNKKYNICSNIIIHGLCSGAFHTIKAVATLKQSDFESYQYIKGIILDSAWPSILDIVETVIHAQTTERCKELRIPFLQPYIACCMLQLYNFCFREHHKKQGSITHLMNEIEQPTLFIHAENDVFVPIQVADPLIKQAQNPLTWFVKDSAHVNSHLLHKQAYTEQLQKFIQSVL